MEYPDSEVVNYNYDSRMLLNSVIGTNTYVSSTTYDSASRIDLRTFGNGTQTDYTYYPWTSQGGSLQTLKSGTASDPTSLQDLAYTYDAVGNISQITNTTASETGTYGYDALNRLTSWTLNGQPEAYSYDIATGNLASKAGPELTYNSQATCSAGTRTIPHAVSAMNANTYAYDCNGNQTTRVIGSDTFNLIYDAENRLVEVKKNSVSMATFTYDGDGKRVKSTVNGTTTLFAGAHYEINIDTNEVTKYYFAGTSTIATRKYIIPQSTTLNYLLGDHLGSTSLVTDATGTLLVETRYKAWGEVRYTTPNQTLPTRYTYTGQYSYINDEATDLGNAGFGLMFYNARWYDPSLGRFAQADSIIPGEVQGLDRYAYVNNSPIIHTDPSGHIGCDEDLNGRCLSFGYGKPDWIPGKNLTSAGKSGFSTYLELFYDRNGWWWSHPDVGGDGDFTIEDFVTLNYNEELSSLKGPTVSEWQEGLVRSYNSWKQAMSDQYTSGKAGLLNFMSRHNGPGTRTGPANFDGPTTGISDARNAVNAMIDPVGSGHSDWARGCIVDAPCRIGSHAPSTPDLPYIRTFINSGCQPSYSIFPANSCSWDASFMFILDAYDSNYWDSKVDQP